MLGGQQARSYCFPRLRFGAYRTDIHRRGVGQITFEHAGKVALEGSSAAVEP